MSLLMDALKRAETSKQQIARSSASKASTPPQDSLELEPLTPFQTAQPTNSLPDLASHLEALDAELASAPSSPTPPLEPPQAAAPDAWQTTTKQTPPSFIKTTEDHTKARQAIQNSFAAKETTPPGASSKTKLFWILGILVLAAITIAAYVFYQINNIGSKPFSPPIQLAATPQPPVAPIVLPALPNNSSAPTVLAQNTSSTVANARIVSSERGEASTTQQPLSESYAPRDMRPSYSDAPPRREIELKTTTPAPDENLLRAHQQVQKQDLDAAKNSYEKALQYDQNNTDALLALAAIAQKQGRFDDAERFNQRAFVANPSDPAAQAAALSGAAASANPLTTESRLKILLTSQPESGPLNFALGNLYSRQARWSEAQQVFFNAVAAEGDNPDYLYNLAISLDHIHQTRLAAQHYRLALDAANKRAATFDRNQVTRRLNTLQQAGATAR